MVYGGRALGQQVQRRGIPADQRLSDVAVPQLVETGSVTGPCCFQMLPDLAAQRRVFLHQVPAMPHQHLQALPVFAQLRLQQREAVDGGTMDSGQVGVVGFGAGVGGLAKALGGKRMNQACLELGTDKSIPDDMVRSEEHTSELQSRVDLVCRLLLEKKKGAKTDKLIVREETTGTA